VAQQHQVQVLQNQILILKIHQLQIVQEEQYQVFLIFFHHQKKMIQQLQQLQQIIIMMKLQIKLKKKILQKRF